MKLMQLKPQISDTFFGACKVKGKTPKRWLAYVLDHIGRTKDEDLYSKHPTPILAV